MKRKISPGGLIFDCFNTLIMLAFFIAMLYPFLYVLNYSLSSSSRIGNSFLLIPIGINLDNYRALLKDPAIYQAMFISVSRSVIGPASMMAVSGMAAFALSKTNLVFGKFFRWMIFFTMYFNAGLIPCYILIKSLGLINSFFVYIIPSMVGVFNIVLIRAFIESLPNSVEEAARIDGANDFEVYWRVIFPVCLPVNAAVILFSAINHWNDFMTTQLYVAMAPKLHTMQYILYYTLSAQLSRSLEDARNSFSNNVVTGQSLKMAMTIITIVPIMCVYPFLQRYFVSGLMVGAIKA